MAKAEGADSYVNVGGHRLRLTNLDKVLYPETGTTKAEVIDYYSRVADALISHARDRPATRGARDSRTRGSAQCRSGTPRE